MKKLTILAVTGFLFATLPLVADTEIVNGIEWSFTIESGEAIIQSSSGAAIPTSTKGAITVPTVLGGYAVVKIGDEAFHSCEGVTQVTIPNGIREIGERVFTFCGASTIDLPNSLTTIGDSAFQQCGSLGQEGGLTSITIPDSVTSMGAAALSGCEYLEKVVIGKGLKIIPDHAFMNCIRLSEVNLPEGVTDIGDWAFAADWCLKELVLPRSVSHIGNNAFSSCSLERLKFEGNAPTVGSDIFEDVSSACEILVKPDSSGWGVSIPGTWNGLTIRYQDVVSTCTVTFDANGGTGGTTRTVNSGAAVGTLPTPAQSGYTFNGWWTAASGGTQVTASTVVTANVTYYAHWTKVSQPNADSRTKTVSAMAGTYSFEVTLPSGGVTYSGFTSSAAWLTFVSWRMNDNAMTLSFKVTENTSTSSRTATLSGSVINNEMLTFTVIQNGKSVTPVTQYTVTFNANGGTGGTTRTVNSGAAVGTLPTPTQSGYTFNGWWTAASGGTQVTASTVVTANVTYYAHWTNSSPAPMPAQQKGFGPGEASDFQISSSERGFVVGVSGLVWSDFPKRTHDGFNAFTDSRIVDREKRSGGFSAADYNYCVDYSYVDLFVWTGWAQSAGFTDEDAFGEALISGSKAKDNLLSQTKSYQEEISTGATFAQTLAQRMAGADRIMAMVVLFDNYVWYGRSYPGTPGLAHGVVCCGYSYDSSKNISDPTALKGLFIIESDNDRENGNGGSSAPDSITYCPVTWDASSRRYSIRNIFGAVGYFDDSVLGKGGIMLRTKDSVSLHKSVDGSFSGGVPSSGGSSGGGSASGGVPSSGGSSGGGSASGGVPSSGGSSGGGSASGGGASTGGIGSEAKIDVSFAKAQIVSTTLYKESGKVFMGAVQLKIAKMGKRGVKVKATALLMSGKKINAKAVNIWYTRGGETRGSIVFRDPIGTMNLTILDDGSFDQYNSSYYSDNTLVGGKPSNGTLEFSANVYPNNLDFGAGFKILDEMLPDSIPIKVSANKWILPKASNLMYKKFKEDGDVWYDLVASGDTSMINVAGLKLKYDVRTGMFKGTFKVYASNEESISGLVKPKLKKCSVSVIGFMIDGKGHGQATMKRPAATWEAWVD